MRFLPLHPVSAPTPNRCKPTGADVSVPYSLQGTLRLTHVRTGVGILILFLTAAVFSASAQEKKPPRDIGGKVMDVTQWHDIRPSEIVLNIVDLPNARFSRVRQRERDKGAVQQQAWFDERNGWIQIEHVLSGAYSTRTTLHFQDEASLKKRISRFYERRGEPFDFEESRSVRVAYDRSGWVSASRSRNTYRLCIMGLVAFISDSSKTAAVADEHYDTGVFLRDCSGKRSLHEIANFLNGMRTVESAYNRSVRSK